MTHPKYDRYLYRQKRTKSKIVPTDTNIVKQQFMLYRNVGLPVTCTLNLLLCQAVSCSPIVTISLLLKVYFESKLLVLAAKVECYNNS